MSGGCQQELTPVGTSGVTGAELQTCAGRAQCKAAVLPRAPYTGSAPGQTPCLWPAGGKVGPWGTPCHASSLHTPSGRGAAPPAPPNTNTPPPAPLGAKVLSPRRSYWGSNRFVSAPRSPCCPSLRWRSGYVVYTYSTKIKRHKNTQNAADSEQLTESLVLEKQGWWRDGVEGSSGLAPMAFATSACYSLGSPPALCLLLGLRQPRLVLRSRKRGRREPLTARALLRGKW